MKTLMVLLGIFILFGCGPKEGPNCHTGVMCHNKTEAVVYFVWSPLYPDDAGANSFIRTDSFNRVEAGESRKLTHYINARVTCMEFEYSTFYDSGHNTDTLKWYVLKEGLSGSNWRDDVLQRYDLSLGDMRALDWTLTYPPDERMKDVKMWPPYSTSKK
jgi:hypothetical protein